MSADACSYIFSAQSAAVNIGWVTPSPKCLCCWYILMEYPSIPPHFNFHCETRKKTLGKQQKQQKSTPVGLEPTPPKRVDF